MDLNYYHKCDECGEAQCEKGFADNINTICAECWPEWSTHNATMEKCAGCDEQFWTVNYHEPTKYCPECRPKYATCTKCKGEFRRYGTDRVCDPCANESRAMDFWGSLPSEHANTKADRIPATSAFRQVMEHNLCVEPEDDGDSHKPSMFIYGKSGTGKTRTVCHFIEDQIRRGIISQGVVIGAAELANEITERTKPGGKGGFAEWQARLVGDDADLVLILDDIHKIRMSDRVQTEFVEIIRNRCSHNTCTICTSEWPMKKVVARFDEIHRDALQRRFMEYFTPIVFRKEKAE